MNWQQKFEAIQAFAGSYDANLRMRKPGDWYVECGMSIGGDGMLLGSYGNGSTPEEAVEDHWQIYSGLPHDRYAVNRKNDRARWNGFMWKPLSEKQAQAIIEGSHAPRADRVAEINRQYRGVKS